MKALSIHTLKTGSRCWVPIASKNIKLVSKPIKSNMVITRSFSLQRTVIFNSSETNIISNDGYLSSNIPQASEEEVFHPTISSSEEIHTPAPVNKA